MIFGITRNWPYDFKKIIGGNEDVIWGKNIRSTLAGVAAETLGASFVTCLSV